MSTDDDFDPLYDSPASAPEIAHEDDLSVTPLVLTEFIRDEGTVVVFKSADHYLIAVDHRPAQLVYDLLARDGEVEVMVDPWQVIGQEVQ